LKTVVIRNPNTSFSPRDFLSGSNLVYRCQLDQAAVPAPATGDAAEIAKYLGAAFMRSTLGINAQLDTLPCCTESQFYQNAPQNVQAINRYAKTIHQHAADHKAYAFGYDDVCASSSFVSVQHPRKLTLTILPF